ncbi:unnamed protein product [Dicrocoelium dendriticum]|nr:unnamed protein product [Dicrocoelium dendriticum]
MRPLKCWFQQLCIVLGLKRPPLPPQRDIPLGPISKQTYVTRPYSLKKLYGDNEIKTSRYTLYGFVFQNLAEQAQRIANFYFICIAVVQLFTDSPVTPAISIIPLLFVFAVTMVKQGYEDFLRHKADREVNHKHVEIVSADGHLTSIKARELTVGDIVLCRSNDTFPCDLLLLSSSEQSGDCLVTTASLDGETNLKRFTALEQTKAYDTPDLIVKELRGSITCQQPVDDLYTFNGRICIELEDGSKQTYPLGPNNLVLRGACLRNTDFIYACAVYTGQDTKMTLNSKGKKTKFSQVERKLNLALAMILLFLLICATISCIVKFAVPRQATWYIPSQDITPWIVVQAFLGFVVLYNYIIPISLYVTIEVQKFFGSMFFEWDLAMYDSKSNAKARVNTSDLIEEMGQIEYLFTDKTGTLTENCMRFRLFATAFGAFSVKDAMIYKLSNQSGRQLSLISDLETALGDQVDLAVTNSELEADGATEMRTSIRTLLLILALCHTIRVEHPLPGEKVARKHKHKRKHREPESSPAPMVDILAQIREPPKRGGSALRRASAVQAASAAVRASLKGRKFKTDDYIYQASSPDEKAFVEACRDLGIVYHGVDQDVAEARVADLEDQFAAVIDGQSLGFALDIRLRDKLAKLLLETSAVLCCRLTPLQKAEVVRLIKESRSPSPVTAAIGDGANDVSMILEAHVSFGVFGKEGRQAARAADYAFARFRFLKRAILFHGHVYYVRVAILVLYFFYKNLLFTLPQFFFEFFCFFSSQTVYPEVYLIFFNITMTSLPIFLFGIFEIPIPEATLLRHPSLYREIVRNRCLSKSTFVLWLGLAIWHSLVAFFGAYFLASLGQAGGGTDPVSGYGGSAIGGLVDFGNFLLMTIFITVNVKVFCFSYTINWAIFVGHLLAFLGNLAIFLFMNFYLFPMQTAAQLYYTLSVLWGGSGLGTAWFGMLCLILLALIPDLTLRGLADQGWVWRLEQMERKEFCSDDSVNSKQPASRQPQRESRGSHQQRPHGEQSTDSVGKVHSSKIDYINPSFEWNNGDTLPRVEAFNYARGSRQPVEGVFNHENVPPLPSGSEPRVKHLPFHVIGGGQPNRCVIVP